MMPATHSSPEPEDALARLMHGPSGPLAWAGFLLGLLALGLFYLAFGPGGLIHRAITPETPPSLLAVNLSFCALFMGVASLYRVRRLPRQTLVRVIAACSLLLGLAGPALYSWQTLQWRGAMQTREIENMRQILAAVPPYLSRHDGHYPPNLEALLEVGLDVKYLSSPYTGHQSKHEGSVRKWTTEDLKQFAAHGDYDYLGAGLAEPVFTSDSALTKNKFVLVVGKEARLRAFVAVGFADGRVELLGPEQTVAALQANHEMRAKAGLPPLRSPTTVPAEP